MGDYTQDILDHMESGTTPIFKHYLANYQRGGEMRNCAVSTQPTLTIQQP